MKDAVGIGAEGFAVLTTGILFRGHVKRLRQFVKLLQKKVMTTELRRPNMISHS